MARASVPTLLSLDRYAKIMGINPMAFNGGNQISLANNNILFPIDNAQNQIWPQYSWQNADQVSREELAQQIWVAEEDIARFLGFYSAPKWVEEEVHALEYNNRREQGVAGADLRYFKPGVHLRYKKLIRPGRRLATYVDNPRVVYTDVDGDGWDERATVSCNLPAGASILDAKVYFHGQSGNQEWEIRPVRTKTLAGVVATWTFDSWLLVDPDLWEAYPTNESDGKVIDIVPDTNCVADVDVYLETNDFTQASVVFYNTDFVDGHIDTQNGFLSSKQGNFDWVIPVPADYNAVTGAWEITDYSCINEFDNLKLWYYAGNIERTGVFGRYGDYLSDHFAVTIAYLATARLDRVFYANNNATSFAARLMKDAAFDEDGKQLYNTEEIQNNPFGTKEGEVRAYRRLRKLYTSLKTGPCVV
jgi:hypothetical protein